MILVKVVSLGTDFTYSYRPWQLFAILSDALVDLFLFFLFQLIYANNFRLALHAVCNVLEFTDKI